MTVVVLLFDRQYLPSVEAPPVLPVERLNYTTCYHYRLLDEQALPVASSGEQFPFLKGLPVRYRADAVWTVAHAHDAHTAHNSAADARRGTLPALHARFCHYPRPPQFGRSGGDNVRGAA